MNRLNALQVGWMVGHARLACNEAGHWASRLARAEKVGRRGEVKVAASENRTLSESVRARGKEEEDTMCQQAKYRNKVSEMLGLTAKWLFTLNAPGFLFQVALLWTTLDPKYLDSRETCRPKNQCQVVLKQKFDTQISPRKKRICPLSYNPALSLCMNSSDSRISRFKRKISSRNPCFSASWFFNIMLTC